MDKVDDWKFSPGYSNNGYTGGSAGSGTTGAGATNSYTGGYNGGYTGSYDANIGLGTQDVRETISSMINVTLSGILLLVALVSIYGIILYVLGKMKKSYELTEKGKHKITLGLPILLILCTVPFYFLYIDFAAIFFYIASFVSGIIIFVTGAKKYTKYKLIDPVMKKRGRNQMLFMVLIVAVLMVYAVISFMVNQLTSATSYSGGGDGYSLGASAGISSSGGQLGLSYGTTTGLGATDTRRSWFSKSTKPSSYQPPVTSAQPAPSAITNDSIGLSVGGAKDVNNFRENIKNNFLPLPTDLTYEGLYYDYYFDTGLTEACTKLFCPSYTSAVSKDPFSKKDEFFLSVGLNSGIQQKDFARKKLNLLIVQDISGSMSSKFNQYYYDQFGNSVRLDEDLSEIDRNKTKMEISNISTVDLMGHLNNEDTFGVVLFDDQAYLAKSLKKVGETDMEKIQGHIMDLTPRGGTNMSAGILEATKQFAEFAGANSNEYENRIIFLTDAMPNTGYTGGDDLLAMTQKNADNKIYTTFIGIGVDFNTELVEKISKIRGANYYSVHSAAEFKKQMDDNFDFMVTPLVFNLELKINAPGYEIKEVYGSPEADQATGQIMKVNTLFPSASVGGESRGGLVLLHLRKLQENGNITLMTSYEDRNGVRDGETKEIVFQSNVETYANTGIRKGIVLARYANMLKRWTIDERARDPQPIRQDVFEENPAPPRFLDVFYVDGIPVYNEGYMLGKWERVSNKLIVSEDYRKLFTEFNTYFNNEMDAIGDKTMQQEVDVLTQLSK